MGFFDEYWLEFISITFSLIAMAVSLYSLYLERIDIEKERFAREITFGPMDDPLVIDRDTIDNRDEVPVQLVNDTGIPQIVNEVWLKVERYPKEITDQQYERFKAFMLALVEAGVRTLGTDGTEDKLKEGLDRRLVGNRTLFLIALMILIINRVRQEDSKDLVVDEKLYRTLRSTSANLDDIAGLLKDPEHDWVVRKLITPQVIEMLEDHIRPLMAESGHPLYTSMKMEVPSGVVKEIDLHLMGFADRLYERLDLVGGEFDFMCRLQADVHRCQQMSRSDLFTLRMVVEPVDLTSLIGEVEEDLRKMNA